MSVKALLTGVVAGAVISVLSLWMVGVAVGRALPSVQTVVALSPIVMALSAFFLSVLGFLVLALGKRPTDWSLLRYIFVSAGYAFVPFLATCMLFREDGEALSYVWSSWHAVLESLPWLVAYLLGAMALLLALRQNPKTPVTEGGAP